MRIENSYRIIPCYSADVSGVCSALFELGGMVVMHDPSGCNSTYNTHDETRWYDNDSLIYITGLTEMDAIMGNDKKVVRDVSDAAKRLKPRFIALCGSPIPFINGTDYNAIARMVEKETGICTFAVETNGTHDYVQGAGQALLKYAEHVLKPTWDKHLLYKINTSSDISLVEHTEINPPYYTKSDKNNSKVINILGATPLDFAEKSTIYSLKMALINRDINISTVFSMLGEENVDKLENAVPSSINLVISAVGFKLARFMFKNYDIPYVVGMPVGDFSAKLCDDIKKIKSCTISYLDRNEYYLSSNIDEPAEIAIIGEPVTSGSIAAAITAKYGKRVSVLCPLEKCEIFLGEGDYCFKGEDQCTELMKKFKHVIADPLYLPICPEGISFHRLPHEAFSGRCCRSEMKNIVTLLD